MMCHLQDIGAQRCGLIVGQPGQQIVLCHLLDIAGQQGALTAGPDQQHTGTVIFIATSLRCRVQYPEINPVPLPVLASAAVPVFMAN